MSALAFAKVKVGQAVSAPPAGQRGARRIGTVVEKKIHRSADFLNPQERRLGLKLINVAFLLTPHPLLLDDGEWFTAEELRRVRL